MKPVIKGSSIILISILLLSACKKSNESLAYTVQYQIAGTSYMNVTYTDQDGLTKTESNVITNWTYSFETGGHGQTVNLTVTSRSGTPVNGTILINGQEVAQNNGDLGNTSLSAQIP